MTTRFHRVAVAALLAATPAVVAFVSRAEASAVPTVARFHLALSKSQPSKNDTLAASPKTIQLWFTESVQAAATGIRITGAADHAISVGAVTVAAAEKSPAVAEIKETLKPGAYTVSWKTMASDGHPSSGTFSFVVGTKSAF